MDFPSWKSGLFQAWHAGVRAAGATGHGAGDRRQVTCCHQIQLPLLALSPDPRSAGVYAAAVTGHGAELAWGSGLPAMALARSVHLIRGATWMVGALGAGAAGLMGLMVKRR